MKKSLLVPSSYTIIISLLIISLIIFNPTAMADYSREFAPVQKGFVTSGERVLPYAPDRIMVKFTPEGFINSKLNVGLQKGASFPLTTTGLTSIDALVKGTGVTRIEHPYSEPRNRQFAEELGTNRWFMFHISGGDAMAAAERFAADPNVEYATPDWRLFPAAVPSDPLYLDQWGHNNTGQMLSYDWATHSHENGDPVGTPGFDSNAQAAWDGSQAYGSASVVIGITDSGVDNDHPDLRQVTGYDFGDDDSDPDDDSGAPGHGTACAGVAASMANNSLGGSGIAGGCSIMPLKIANSAGSMYLSALQSALYYAADNGADIVSMSIGAPLSSDPATDAALLYAYNAGVTLLAATGNENTSTIHYPAINQYVIGIGAASPCGERKRSSSNPLECNPGVSTDPNGYTCDGERWWGSNWGVNVQDAAGAVDVIAPTIMPTTDIGGSGGYDPSDYSMWFNGTSCATPYAAGVCALAISADPTLTPAEVRDKLVTSAQDIISVESGAGWDRYAGYGMVDADAILGSNENPPVAAFSGSPTSGPVSLTVDFTDESLNNPTTWAWDFGDGIGTSTIQHPSYTYDSPGTYTVTLTVTNAYGSDDEVKIDYITVTATPPVAAFSATPLSGPASLTVDFTDESSNNPTTWNWDFGDGIGTSTIQHPSYTYDNPGTYTVILLVTNAYGSDDEIKVDYITVTEGGVNQAFALSDIPVDGTVSGNYSNTHVSDNSYEAITEIQTDDRLAKKRKSLLEHKWNFYVASGSFVNFYVEAYRTNNTENDNFAFEYSTDGVVYNPMVTVNSSTEQTYSASLPSSVNGTVYVRVMDTDRTKANISLETVYIDYMYFESGAVSDPPVADFEASPTAGDAPLFVHFTDLSSNAPTSWDWDFGDGVGTSTDQHPDYTYNNPGTYTVTLIATNAYGSDTEIKTDYITVTEGGTTVLHVSDMTVNRKTAGPNVTGRAYVTIVDQNNNPIANATVYGFFNAPNTDTKSGVTGEDGVALISSTKTKSPPADFCFEVTDVVLAGATYDEGSNVVTNACESGWVSGAMASSRNNAVPTAFGLFQNYPNPFRAGTEITFGLPSSAHVRLEIFNVRGERVVVLADRTFGPGTHIERWEAGKLASGIYFYRLSTGNFVQTKKMILLR